MKDNKYYTPSIEEFHVGFEYEKFNTKTNAWETLIIEENDLFSDREESSTIELICSSLFKENKPFWSTEKIRVKYLDREDIESLGWKYNFNNWFSLEVPHTTHSNEYFDLEGRLISFPYYSLFVEGTGVRITNVDGDLLFNGDIKNKSELKMILKMIGIQ